jgi:hypothetical protein
MLLLAFLAAPPAIASPGIDTRCDESSEAILDAPPAELSARPVSSGDEDLKGHILEQRLEAATRSVFADDEAEAAEPEEEAAVEAPPAKAGGPTASDPEPATFKRQMYRRDI